MTVAGFFGTALAACAFTEFVGYWLHKLLHSEKVKYLSRSHMIHHLVVYACNEPQRKSGDYLRSTDGRANLLGIGLEWLVPSGLVLGLCLAAFRLRGVPVAHQGVFVAVSLSWGYFMFGYMHDAMHLKGFWMIENPIFGKWFLHARKLHDIHHMTLADSGRMEMNYGICFFFFDRLFGTRREEFAKFNAPGLLAAKERYSYIF